MLHFSWGLSTWVFEVKISIAQQAHTYRNHSFEEQLQSTCSKLYFCIESENNIILALFISFLCNVTLTFTYTMNHTRVHHDVCNLLNDNGPLKIQINSLNQ